MYLQLITSKKTGNTFPALCADSRSGIRVILSIELGFILKFFTFADLDLISNSDCTDKIYYERSI